MEPAVLGANYKVQMSRMFRGVAVLILMMFGAADPAAATACATQAFGNVTVDIDGRKLIAKRDGKTLARRTLPVVGSAWKCLAMRAFPKKRLLFVEWNGGQAGTRSIFQKVSLLAFSVTPGGVTPRGEWIIRQGYHGDGPERIEADRTWRLEEHDWGIDVILEGTRRIGVEPK